MPLHKMHDRVHLPSRIFDRFNMGKVVFVKSRPGGANIGVRIANPAEAVATV